MRSTAHKPLNKVKVVFPGDVRNNMCYAWMIGAAKMGMHFVGIGPEELAKEMDPEIVKRTFATARETGGLIEITDNMDARQGRGRDLRRHLGLHGRGGPDPRAHQSCSPPTG